MVDFKSKYSRKLGRDVIYGYLTESLMNFVNQLYNSFDKKEMERTTKNPQGAWLGIIGEVIFALLFWCNMECNYIGKRYGTSDFPGGLEVKCSKFPYVSNNLHLFARSDYVKNHLSDFYGQVHIIEKSNKDVKPGSLFVMPGFTFGYIIKDAPIKNSKDPHNRGSYDNDPCMCNSIYYKRLESIIDLDNKIYFSPHDFKFDNGHIVKPRTIISAIGK